MGCRPKSQLPQWVTAPLAPGGAGRQRERLLWSCCDQGSTPAAGCLRSSRPRPGGVVRLECCRAGATPPSSGGGGARARHLLLLKACCLRNNRCTQVGRQGQRTRSTLSWTLKVRTGCLPRLSTDIKDGLGRAECQLAHKSCHHSNELDQLLRQWG